MTNLENIQLIHPEFLTEDTLLQVLADRCVEVPRLKTSNKAELVELFKRVALPLPQRSHDNSMYLGRKLIDLGAKERQREAALPPVAPMLSDAESSSNNNNSVPEHCKGIAERLKLPRADARTESKRIRLSKSSATPNTPCDTSKRKSKIMIPEPPNYRKRQKITWP